jgi:hypothetical protein
LIRNLTLALALIKNILKKNNETPTKDITNGGLGIKLVNLMPAGNFLSVDRNVLRRPPLVISSAVASKLKKKDDL